MADTKPRSAEMHPGPGFRVQMQKVCENSIPYPQFAEFETPDISDLLNRLYAVDSSIRPLTARHERLCGPVCTVRVFPGDNLMVHKALDVAQRGDIIVVDARGATSNAVLGDIICTKALHRGIAGFIVDGLIRDLPGIVELGLPVFARGTTAVGPLHRGPGEINYPICCRGVVMNPGDVVVADSAGIVLIPRDAALELLQQLKIRRAANAAYLEAVQRGDFSNQWVDRLLDSQNCPIIPDSSTKASKAPETSTLAAGATAQSLSP
jgi:RraA family protein